MSEPAFTCPVCGRSSWHPTDGEQGWCGNCHGYTREPAPPGTRWVLFHAEDGSIRGRLIDDNLQAGDRYELVGEGGIYVYDGSAFVEVTR